MQKARQTRVTDTVLCRDQKWAPGGRLLLGRPARSTGGPRSPLQRGSSLHVQSWDRLVRGQEWGVAELCWTWVITTYAFLSFALVFHFFSKALTSLFFFSGHVCEKFLNRMLSSDPMIAPPESAFLWVSRARPLSSLRSDCHMQSLTQWSPMPSSSTNLWLLSLRAMWA